MSVLRSIPRALLAAIALCYGAAVAWPSFAMPSGTVRATAAEMFALANESLRRGNAGAASVILDLLSHDPNPDVRSEARFREAKILVAAHENARAAVLLRRILDDRPSATPVRLELARVLEKLGDKDGAWRQLRAAQAAGLPASVARIVDRYSEALRAQRPFGASFEIAIAPNSNINRATRSDTLGTVLGDFQIGDEAKAKSGSGVAVRAQAYRRLAIGGDDSLLFRLSGFGDLYRKPKFNDIALDLGAGTELRLGSSRVNFELGATQRWFGQKPFVRSARIAATWTRPVDSRTQMRLSGSASLIDNQLNDLQDGKAYQASVDIERALSSTTGVAANLALDREALKDAGYATTGWRAGLLVWRDLGRMTFTAQANFGKLHADERLALFPERRSDRYASLSLGATFRQMQWRGFAPVVRFTIERNRSSIAFYDYRRTRSEIGVVRAF
jgi:hypothetical protein